MTEQTVAILVQTGAVGISFALIGLLYWVIKIVVGNHIAHSTEAQIKFTTAIEKLTGVIKALDKRLNSKK